MVCGNRNKGAASHVRQSPAVPADSSPYGVDRVIPARRFGLAQASRSAALLEDYTKLIADLLQEQGEARTIDVARSFAVTHATAAKAIGRLKREGLAVAQRYRGVFLTDAGYTLAERVRARRRLLNQTLLVLGVPPEAAERDSQGMEHFVSDATLAALENYLRNKQRRTR